MLGMYTLRGRDLSHFLDGEDASSASQPEPWTLSALGPSLAVTEALPRGLALASPRLPSKGLPAVRRSTSAAEAESAFELSSSPRDTREAEEEGKEPDGGEQRQPAAVDRPPSPISPAVVEALRRQTRGLAERLQRKDQELQKAQEQLRRFEQAGRQLRQTEQRQAVGSCTAPCCIPVSRLERAGLNQEPLCEMDAFWAGQLFSGLAAQMKASGMTLAEAFKKYKNTQNKIDAVAFRDFVKRFLPELCEDRITRLFYFADANGSQDISFMEFLRAHGCDLNGNMGEEYFEHVMVRLHGAISRRGGLATVFHMEEQHKQGAISRARMIEVILGLGIQLTRHEAFEIATRFAVGGDVRISDFNDTMQMCASASFVTEDWVHRLFDQIVHAVHKDAKSLAEALRVGGKRGSLDRDDLRGLLRRFQPGLRDGQIDRVFGFLCAGSDKSTGAQRGRIDIGHFFHVVCQATLGASTGGRLKGALPSETMENLSLQLKGLCGSIADAFNVLDPCLCFEEFRAALLSLGFKSEMDFKTIFRLLDVNRVGRVSKSTFLQVLELPDLPELRASSPDSVLNRAASEKEEGAAQHIQRFYRGKHKAESSGAKQSGKLAGGLFDFLQRRMRVHHRACADRFADDIGEVPAFAFNTLCKDHQRAINRVMVLESELNYLQRLTEQGPDGRPKRGLAHQVRELEAANRALAMRLQEGLTSRRRGPVVVAPGITVTMGPGGKEPGGARGELRPSDSGRVSTSQELAIPDPPWERLDSCGSRYTVFESEASDGHRSATIAQLALAERKVAELNLELQVLQRAKGHSEQQLLAQVETLQHKLTQVLQDASIAVASALAAETLGAAAGTTGLHAAAGQAAESEEEAEHEGSGGESGECGEEGGVEAGEVVRADATAAARKVASKPKKVEPWPAGAAEATVDSRGPETPVETPTVAASDVDPAEANALNSDDLRAMLDNTSHRLKSFKSALRDLKSSSDDIVQVVEATAKSGQDAPATSSRKVRTSEDAILDAVRVFAMDGQVSSFLERVQGIAVAQRFIIKSVITAHSDFLVLRCTDLFLCRDVSVKIPIYYSNETVRRTFLRECCIHTFLADVNEVQDVIHFPGLCERMVFCVMELLEGRLLSERLEAARRGDALALPRHDAAELCNALLHGLEECHKHGALHLDIKPSAVWEVTQPAGVIVKILDFGLARLTMPDMLASGALQFFDGVHNGTAMGEPALEVEGMEAVPGPREPALGMSLEEWSDFAPYLFLKGVGHPWYMSPARWCCLALRQQREQTHQPELRWCDLPREHAVSIAHGEGDDMDAVSVRYMSDTAYVVQARHTAPHFDRGSFFEVVVRKIWPHQLLTGEPDKPSAPIGFAVGFTRSPPDWRDLGEPCRARDLDRAWVVGYDGRVFVNGKEVEVLDDEVPAIARQKYRSDDWPVGPLGWSFGVLRQGDRVGLLADERGFLTIFVNRRPVSQLRLPGLNGLEFLYPVLELCGSGREIGLEPNPSLPSLNGEEARESSAEQLAHVQNLASRAYHVYADTYAAAVLVQDCFCASSAPTVPLLFTRMLVTAVMWLSDGCPAIDNHNDMLTALNQWSTATRVRDDLPPEIAHVLRRVLDNRSTSQAIRFVADFRAALAEVTSCSHVSPEFLRSHVKTSKAPDLIVFEKRRRPRWTISQSQTKVLETVVVKRDQLWDLRAWTLSSSHMRRIVLILNAEEGAHIGTVAISRLEPNVPLDLMMKLAESCEHSFDEGAVADRHRAPSASQRPRLEFARAALPADTCPLSFAALRQAHAVGLVLRFVRRINLEDGAEVGKASELPGASLLAGALEQNRVLREVSAGNQNFGDIGATLLSGALTKGSLLQKLDLPVNGITGQGCAALADAMKNPAVRLRSLDLCGNRLGDEGCVHLAGMLRCNETLTVLLLQRNGIGADGAEAIASALLENATLMHLDLGRNAVCGSGASALLAATRSNISLALLNLQDNGLDSTAGVHMAEALSGRRVALPRLQRLLTPDLAAPQAGLRRPSVLEIRQFSPTAAEAADVVPSGSALRSLNLRHNELGGAGAAALLGAIAAGSQISSLSLAWNGLGLEAAVAVAGILGPSARCAVRELDLRDNRLGEGGALALAFGQLTPQLTDKGGTAALPALTSSPGPGRGRRSVVMLAYPGDADDSVGPQYMAKHLRELNLANCRLESDSVAQLALVMSFFSNLEVLLLYNNPGIGASVRLVASVADGGKTELQAVHNPVVNPCLRDFGHSLPPSLRRLSLASCALGNDAARALAWSLAHLVGLEELDLTDNNLGKATTEQAVSVDDPVGDWICEALCMLLKATGGPRTLVLTLNLFGDRHLLQLAQVLSQEAPRGRVDLSANAVSREAWDIFAIVDGLAVPSDSLGEGSQRSTAGGFSPLDSLLTGQGSVRDSTGGRTLAARLQSLAGSLQDASLAEATITASLSNAKYPLAGRLIGGRGGIPAASY